MLSTGFARAKKASNGNMPPPPGRALKFCKEKLRQIETPNIFFAEISLGT